MGIIPLLQRPQSRQLPLAVPARFALVAVGVVDVDLDVLARGARGGDEDFPAQTTDFVGVVAGRGVGEGDGDETLGFGCQMRFWKGGGEGKEMGEWTECGERNTHIVATALRYG